MHVSPLGISLPESNYHRIVLKLSGDILKGTAQSGIDFNVVQRIASEIITIHQSDVDVAVVVGGGNLIRGAEVEEAGVDRITADNMGMLTTVINALALQNAIENLGNETRVMSAITITELVEPLIRRRAIRHLEKRRIVIFAGGTGNPFFTTDTAAALRAEQIRADIILKGTKVDGVYDDDPNLFENAVKFDVVDFMDVIRRGLRVMDLTAITFCRDYNIPILVFNILEHGNLIKIINGHTIGTLVKEIKQ